MAPLAFVVAFLVAAARINNGLTDSVLPNGPGLTLDEPFNIGQGVYLARALASHGPLVFTKSGAQEVFGSEDYLPDHPPLGRLILGIAHESTDWLIRGAEKSPLNVPAARLGACLMFAFLTGIVCEWTRRQFGIATGLTASAFLILTPQLTGHARLATLETATALAWFAALVPLLAHWTQPTVPNFRQASCGGILFGLLMLTKMQGILLPPLVVAWALWQYRARAIRPLLCWGITGGIVFLACWPWLWLDPVNHTLRYLGRAADRQVLYVWYFGARYADKLVPWHFPIVMTAITIPGFLLAGIFARSAIREFVRAEQLLLASAAWPLIVFSLPGTPVYDGTRLFLCILPSLAILGARGLCLAVGRVAGTRRTLPTLAAGVIVLLGLRSILTAETLSPFAISTYSELIGGGRGAARLGMEASYWADGLNSDFWNQVPHGSTIMVAPVSHQFQLNALESLVPIVRERSIRLIPFEYDTSRQKGLLLLLHRLADLRPSMRDVPAGATLVAEVRHDDMVLARLVDTTNSTWVETP